jgi:catechol 1,2-dioxygenase
VVNRCSYRPAHIYVIASFPDHEALVTQIFKKGDDQTADDVVFTASENMLGDFRADGDRFRLQYDFPLERGISVQPKAPIAA